MAIMFQVRRKLRLPHESEFIPVKKTGTRFDLGGEVVELFRISVLAQALDRTVIVLKKWERDGNLPRPLFVLTENQCTHWYSAAQVINCHRLMIGYYRGRKNLPPEELKLFFDSLKRAWNAREIVVGEDGLFLERTG